MPSSTPSLTAADVRRYVEQTCLTPSAARRVGVEREWFTTRHDDPHAHVDFDLVRAIVESTRLPGGSRVTWEPGGQLELSSRPEHGAAPACAALEADGDAVEEALRARGIGLLGIGMDPLREPRRVIDAPRYRAMEAYFDTGGAAGRRMMRSTAAIQLNLEAGSIDEADVRWKRAHALAPTLGATFANSPLAAGRPTGWRSGRLATWMAIDPTRTAPAVSDLPVTDAWERYVLGANVMFIRASETHFVPQTTPMPFERWLHEGHELGYPTIDDLDYHATTLFPPVRLRGWLELRFLDALPGPWWQVAVAITTALLDDDEAAAFAERACAPAADLWHQAARAGLTHPILSLAAKECFAAGQEALSRMDAPRATQEAVAAYYDRYVARGRTPADDRLDEWAREQGAGRTIRLDDVQDAEIAWT